MIVADMDSGYVEFERHDDARILTVAMAPDDIPSGVERFTGNCWRYWVRPFSWTTGTMSATTFPGSLEAQVAAGMAP